MDDTILWQSGLREMQFLLDALIQQLAVFGLYLNPKKCQLLVSGQVGQGGLRVGDFTLLPRDALLGITVMHLPVGFSICEMDVIACLLDRARNKFFSVRDMLVANSSLKLRLVLLERVVMGCVRWIVGTIYPTAKIQQQLNAAQIQCLREMLHIRRRGGELWVDFETRACRDARAVLWNEGVARWGDLHLRQFWRYALVTEPGA